MNISENIMHRYKNNPIITPKMFDKAIGTFNCGQTMYNGKTILLVPIQRMDDQVPSVYVAESEDGYNFTFHDKPFITRSEKYKDLDHWVIDLRVTYFPEDNCYYIMRPMNSSWGTITLLGKTTDFENFEEMGIVALPHNRVPCLFPEKINGKYARIDRPYEATSKWGNLWISYSEDLIHWGEYQPLLKPFTNWGADKIGPTPPIRTKDGWLEIFHGVKCGRYSIGAVLLDLEDPSKVIAKLKSPILTPNEPYEYQGHCPNGVVFPCGAIVEEEKDEIRIYYGACDCAIGVATGKLSELLDAIKYEGEHVEDWIWH